MPFINKLIRPYIFGGIYSYAISLLLLIQLAVIPPAFADGCHWHGSGRFFNCYGDLQGGVYLDHRYEFDVSIHSLTHDITPASSRPGVRIYTNGVTGEGGHEGGLVLSRIGLPESPYFRLSSAGQNGTTHAAIQVIFVGGEAKLITEGTYGYGIDVSGHGGNGGNGASAVDLELLIDAGIAAILKDLGVDVPSKSDAADGGNGGNGPAVSIRDIGSIVTNGAYGHGIYSWSQGGTGGNGGSAIGVLYAHGGDGGHGGVGGSIKINNFSDVTTQGDTAHGVYVISNGGNGGSGGAAGSVGAGMGGNGGYAGNGGNITLTNAVQISATDPTTGSIKTSGIGAFGIYARSEGGKGGAGGGGGGFYGGGGSGATGGSAGNIDVRNNGGIETSGHASNAILLESIGGGSSSGGGAGGVVAIGGSGAEAGNGGSIVIHNYTDGVVSTAGNNASVIFAQSVGGGGGSGAGAGGGVAIGGVGYGGGDGGSITLKQDGVIKSEGSNAPGITLQSIGGSGGFGGGSGGAVSVGGGGGNSGNGGNITVTGIGSISTEGLDSFGIHIQSVGGGGGFGGGSGGEVSVGGKGGASGSGGIIQVEYSGDITTNKNGSSALFAQSIGGGGGFGGGSGGVVSVGGDGGGDGNGGEVSVSTSGAISTSGEKSYGIYAQSIGAGGGYGGGSGGFISVGGAGAISGNGGNVTVEQSSGEIDINSSDSAGILAQSVGGGGGTGVIRAVDDNSGSGGGSGGLLSIGGGSSAGGQGGEVTVTVNGNLSTSVLSTCTVTKTNNCAVPGVIAQSIGGGGGSGGGSGGAISVGGTGSGGGNAAAVTITSTGTINVAGINSPGLLAQSIGGGGGHGLGSGGVVSVGGSGGGGGNGDLVTISQMNGEITTTGKNAEAIYAQSVGGGGGYGSGSGGAVSIGGSGTGGGDGGMVNVTVDSQLSTDGEYGIGIKAQSIGGGGGHGAGSGGAVSVGGSSGASGNGGEVTVILNGGSVSTMNDHAGAVDAQSIGGGGGTGITDLDENTAGAGSGGIISVGGSGSSGGAGKKVVITNKADISTQGDHSYGISAASMGGGGGDAGGSGGLISVGGSGGVGGDGGEILLTHIGSITTEGKFAPGVEGKSIGGGGGAGALSIGAGVFASVSVGGSGGQGGNGGNITLGSAQGKGLISTNGDHSPGIVLSSVGGGGGDAGFSIAGSIGIVGSVSVSVGGSGGEGGSGGMVSIDDYHGEISTGGYASPGIQVSSVGGGGGDAGFSVNGTLSDSFALGVSVGGSGGDGGDGGNIIITNYSKITTTGSSTDSSGYSNGIEAQSIGGGGGHGAFSVNGSGGSMSGSLSVGGSGGVAGSAGTVIGGAIDLTNYGDIVTTGSHSKGIFAQSLGGGGGDAGFSVSGDVNVEFSSTAVSVGGSGGTGGIASDVTVTNEGTVQTNGSFSHGVSVQSIGGGGGYGAFSVAADGNLGAEADSLALAVSVGGSGGSGNDSGAVYLTNNAAANTSGNGANALIGRSIGGGGGEAGFSATGLITINTNATPKISVGGSGGAGGDGGYVNIQNTAMLETSGNSASGVYAESIGGGGGDAIQSVQYALGVPGSGGSLPTLSAGLSIGGTGGVAGSGGVISITNNAAIKTSGNDSYGIQALSVGGGGGTGGQSSTVLTSFGQQDSETISTAVSVGGDGGSGNTGSAITISNTTGSDIVTSGQAASAIAARSIGGGGGRAGSASAYNSVNSMAQSVLTTDCPAGVPECRKSTVKNISVSLIVGGTGGKGSSGGGLTLENAGNVSTLGSYSHGIFAQSIGNGGGEAGNASISPIIPLTDMFGQAINGGVTSLLSANTQAIRVKSFALTVGGGGGEGGNGGAINVTNSGEIAIGSSTSFSLQSMGIFAQSVGGGGGDGGAATLASSARIAVGGKGGGSGDGGAVTVSNDGMITNYAIEGIGILAQSVGGGGGINFAKLVPGDLGIAPVTVAAGGQATGVFGYQVGLGAMFGGAGGSGGDGDDVTITNSGSITTHGIAGYGILAQSVGGGGGIGRPSSLIAVPIWMGTNGGGGVSGDIDITQNGTIMTTGAGAHGIFAQAASATLTTATSVTINVNGDVSAAGDGASAIFIENLNVPTDVVSALGQGVKDIAACITEYLVPALCKNNEFVNALQNLASSGGSGAVNIPVANGVNVTGGTGEYSAGITVFGNTSTTITNSGTITSADGIEGTAVYALAWNNRTIDNYGTITGDMILDGCRDIPLIDQATCEEQISGLSTSYTVINHQGALINAGNHISLAGSGTVINNGRFAPGGAGRVMKTVINGNYTQGNTGELDVDVDFSKTGQSDEIDLLSISGSANIQGDITWFGLNAGYLQPGTHSATFLTSQYLTQGGIVLNQPDSVIITSSKLTNPDTNSLGLQYTVDFAPNGLNANQAAIGQHIANVEMAGGLDGGNSAAATAFSFKNLQDLGAYYDSIGPEPHTIYSSLALTATKTLADASHSCKQKSGEYHFASEGQCSWFRISINSIDTPLASSASASTLTTNEISMGIQREINQNNFLGFSAKFINGEGDNRKLMNTESDVAQLGAIYKLVHKNTIFSLFGTFGHAWHHSQRTIPIDDITTVYPESDLSSTFFAIQGRIAQTFEFEQKWYIQPFFGLKFDYIHTPGFLEQGAPGFNLEILSSNDKFLTARPGVELGADFDAGSDVVVRPYIRYNENYIISGQPKIRARFAGAPAGSGQFVINSSMEKRSHEVSVGMYLLGEKNVALRLEGWLETTESSQNRGFNIKVQMPF